MRLLWLVILLLPLAAAQNETGNETMPEPMPEPLPEPGPEPSEDGGGSPLLGGIGLLMLNVLAIAVLVGAFVYLARR